MISYDPHRIEPKWQGYWEENKTFETRIDLARPKYYVLDMFPYPSGAGLHVGHPEGYTATDVVARYKRMRGFNVLHPMGWDAFGLPAERSAVREGVHPAEITRRNIDNFRRQIQRIGFSYDWSREVSTSDPAYYRWTQWIFLKLHERGLAYEAEVPVNWCPALGTVLANEEVKEGRYVETGDPVEKRYLRQWMLRITAYAERLLQDLDGVDWPEGVKEMQRNWIGKSEGATLRFELAGTTDVQGGRWSFEVFTTRPDTLFGATYCVLAPEHPLVEPIVTDAQRAAVEAYRAEAARKTDIARTELTTQKTGVFTGAFAINPANGEEVPIWIADYVVMTYGTGAIMAVPAHDQRDWEFAQKFGLPVRTVVVPSGGASVAPEGAFVGHSDDEVLVDSDRFTGMPSPEAKRAIVEWLAERGAGRATVHYKLRDWLFSRQRYWGEPFPLIRLEDGTVVPLPPDSLPIELPHLEDYKPTEDGQPPLARAKEWLQTSEPRTGQPAVRETNTMPQWAGSCWYYLRFVDPHNQNEPFSREAERYWMPVDLYIGGVEHAVLHLLYARFWHKVLFDCGLVSTREPFQKLFNQGMILHASYQDAAGKYYHPSEVEVRDGRPLARTAEGQDVELVSQVEKMSKSRSNVVNPDEIIEKYGADAFRLYELFMGPLEVVKPWQTSGVEGTYRFLGRLWRLFHEEEDWLKREALSTSVRHSEEVLRLLHESIQKVTHDIEALCFNTAIAQLMVLVRDVQKSEEMSRELAETIVKLVAPFAPHVAEELWSRLGHGESIAYAPWPEVDARHLAKEMITVVLQVNGKLRDRLELPADSTKEDLEQYAMNSDKVQAHVGGKPIRKVIVVPGKLVNVVV
jgi:leucyl-tRNA synthetase